MTLSRQTRRLASTALAATAIVVIAAASPLTSSHSNRATQMEIRWVRAHLDSVLRELPQHDVSGLGAAQLAHRAKLLGTLQLYRDAGGFPRNYDFAAPTPYFTDRKTGVLCAVGYLLESTGRRDIVDRVTRANNNVRVHELAGDTALTGWLSENGLTLDEAARIQVVYVRPSPFDMSPGEIRRAATLAVTPFALAGSVITGTWNALSNANGRRIGPAVGGIISGGMAIALGAELSGTQGIPRSSGMIMAGVGSATAALAIRSLVHRHETTEAIRAEQRTIVVVPMLAMTKNAAPGISVTMKF